jgi:Golgi nucleoside diphosphatase
MKGEYDFESNSLSLKQDSELGSTFEIGGAVGGSYKFNNGFFLNGRYALGFTDAFDDSNFDSDAIKNSGF